MGRGRRRRRGARRRCRPRERARSPSPHSVLRARGRPVDARRRHPASSPLLQQPAGITLLPCTVWMPLWRRTRALHLPRLPPRLRGRRRSGSWRQGKRRCLPLLAWWLRLWMGLPRPAVDSAAASGFERPRVCARSCRPRRLSRPLPLEWACDRGRGAGVGMWMVAMRGILRTLRPQHRSRRAQPVPRLWTRMTCGCTHGSAALAPKCLRRLTAPPWRPSSTGTLFLLVPRRASWFRTPPCSRSVETRAASARLRRCRAGSLLFSRHAGLSDVPQCRQVLPSVPFISPRLRWNSDCSV